jgi:hypothetical protein
MVLSVKADYVNRTELVASSCGGLSHHLQTRVTDGKACPRTVLELLIVAEVGAGFRQVASP